MLKRLKGLNYFLLKNYIPRKLVDMYLFSFEKLQVWQEARTLIVAIYKATEHFPPEEKFGLINQLRRAAVSIASRRIFIIWLTAV